MMIASRGEKWPVVYLQVLGTEHIESCNESSVCILNNEPAETENTISYTDVHVQNRKHFTR